MEKFIAVVIMVSAIMSAGTMVYISSTKAIEGDAHAELNFKQCHEMHQHAYNTQPYEAFDACTLIMQGKAVF